MTDDRDSCGCTSDVERAEHDARYRRALRWVVSLNIEFGLCELAAVSLPAARR